MPRSFEGERLRLGLSASCDSTPSRVVRARPMLVCMQFCRAMYLPEQIALSTRDREGGGARQTRCPCSIARAHRLTTQYPLSRHIRGAAYQPGLWVSIAPARWAAWRPPA